MELAGIETYHGQLVEVHDGALGERGIWFGIPIDAEELEPTVNASPEEFWAVWMVDPINAITAFEALNEKDFRPHSKGGKFTYILLSMITQIEILNL